MSKTETFELTVNAKTENLARIAAFITDMARRWGLTPQESYELQMAVDEACTNVIEHSYEGDESGVIQICCQREDDMCCVLVCDRGKPFDPQSVPEPDIDAPLEERDLGGLGIYLMRQLMDEVRFEFDAKEGNRLTLVKRRRPIVTREAERGSDVTIVMPRGRLDANLAPHLQTTFDELMAAGRYNLLIDFSLTHYISSLGLKVLLAALRDVRAQGGDLKLCALPQPVHKVFQITGFTELFTLYDGEQAALAAFERATADPHPKDSDGESQTS